MHELLAITKALADETRVRALMSLRTGELCLCQIIEILGLSPSSVSRHMNILHQAGLIRRRKEGTWHFYRLTDDVEAEPLIRQTLSWVQSALVKDRSIQTDDGKGDVVRKRELEELSTCYRG